MSTTNKAINKAIKAATGYDVKLHKGGGVCSFYSDDEDTSLLLCGFNSTSVYVNTINTYTVEEWVEEFKYMLKENEEFIENSSKMSDSDEELSIIIS